MLRKKETGNYEIEGKFWDQSFKFEKIIDILETLLRAIYVKLLKNICSQVIWNILGKENPL